MERTFFFDYELTLIKTNYFLGTREREQKKEIKRTCSRSSLKNLKIFLIFFGGLNRRNFETFVLRARFFSTGTGDGKVFSTTNKRQFTRIIFGVARESQSSKNLCSLCKNLFHLCSKIRSNGGVSLRSVHVSS